MEARATQQVKEKPVNPVPMSGGERHVAGKPPAVDAAAALEQKGLGYGLPCSNCPADYPPDFDPCPICKSRGRVPPEGAPLPVSAASAPTPPNAPEDE